MHFHFSLMNNYCIWQGPTEKQSVQSQKSTEHSFKKSFIGGAIIFSGIFLWDLNGQIHNKLLLSMWNSI